MNPVNTHDEALLGLWVSGPFDYGAMESSDIAFRDDGHGWTRWATFGGVMEVSPFEWSCPAPGLVRLRYRWYLSGPWDERADGWRFAAVETSEPDTSTVDATYRIGEEASPVDGEGLTVLRLGRPIAFCDAYAWYGHVSADDDPSSPWVRR